jgi:hypothetical protein
MNDGDSPMGGIAHCTAFSSVPIISIANLKVSQASGFAILISMSTVVAAHWSPIHLDLSSNTTNKEKLKFPT